jgi:hypothetical protein
MVISIVNHTGGQVTDEELQTVIRAINRQLHEDFCPYWGFGATLRLEGRSAAQPDQAQPADMRGDAVIYLWNQTDVPGAIGYHAANGGGIPFGFVFTEVARSIGEHWSVTLSHEALELVGDPETNLLVIGPHPAENRDVFHWFEMCDAVQAEKYEIDGVMVSNFLLPLYFTGTRDTDEVGARNDFLGRSYDNQTLRSFGINPGGYVGFFDPQTGNHETYSIRGDAIAAMRMAIKATAKETRRSIRYRDPKARERIEAMTAEVCGTDGKRAAAAKAAAGPRRLFGPITATTRPAGASGRSSNGHGGGGAARRRATKPAASKSAEK